MLISIASLFVRGGQRTVAFGDGGVALGAQVPDGGGVLDQESEVVGIEQLQHARGVGAEGVAHAGIEAVVDVGQHQIEVRLGAARLLQLIEPLLLHLEDESGAAVEEVARGEGLAGAFLGAGVKREGLAGAFERFEVELGEVDAVPIEARDQVADAGADRAEAVGVAQVHELAPVELGVLAEGGLSRATRDDRSQNFSLTCGSSNQA